MTNNELVVEFSRIANILDCFDFYLELDKLNKQYKTTPFYKKSRMNIRQAYGLFMKHKVFNIINFLNKITNVQDVADLLNAYINAIDEDTLNEFLDKIVSVINIEQLKGLQDNLSNTIKELKTV